MHPPNLLFALVLVAALGVKAAFAQPALGAQGAEGEPHRLQQWLVPAPDPVTAAHAVLFRPPGEGPFPLAVIAHASTQNVMRRAQMPQPEYRALAAMARRVENTSKIRAAATRPITPNPAASRRMRLPLRSAFCASNPSSAPRPWS